MHDSQKRAITVQGRFMAPVCIGAPAFIRESNGYLWQQNGSSFRGRQRPRRSQ